MDAVLPSAVAARQAHPFPHRGQWPAYRLCNVGMVNWNLFEAEDIPVNGSTAIIGRNGAGKSVILDAIQTVLTGCNSRYFSFNSRAIDHAPVKRNLLEYCLGEMIDGGPPERPDGCMTYLMLAYEAMPDANSYSKKRRSISTFSRSAMPSGAN